MDDLIASIDRLIRRMQSASGDGSLAWNTVLETAKYLREDRAALWTALANDVASDWLRQQKRHRYRRWRKFWIAGMEYLDTTYPESSARMRSVLPNVTDRSYAMCGRETGQVDPFRQDICRYEQPKESYIPFMVLFGLYAVASIVLAILGHRHAVSGWIQLVLFGGVVLGCVFRIAFLSQWVGETQGAGLAVDQVLERLSMLIFSCLLVFFAYILTRASLAEFYPEATTLPRVLLGVTISVEFVLVAYSISMSIVSENSNVPAYVFDASRLLIAFASTVFSGLLVLAFAFTISLAQSAPVKSRLFYFLIGASVLLAVFITQTVLACLFTFVSVAVFGAPYLFFGFVSELLLATAVLLYCALPFLTLAASRKEANLMTDSMSQESTVPLVYASY